MKTVLSLKDSIFEEIKGTEDHGSKMRSSEFYSCLVLRPTVSLLRPLELLHILAFLNGGMNKHTKFPHFLQFCLHKFILFNCFVPHLNGKYLEGLSCYK